MLVSLMLMAELLTNIMRVRIVDEIEFFVILIIMVKITMRCPDSEAAIMALPHDIASCGNWMMVVIHRFIHPSVHSFVRSSSQAD